MRGKISEVHKYSCIVLNWLKRRGVNEKSEESDISQDVKQNG